MRVKEQSEKLIIIDDCTCQELDNLDFLAYSRLSGDGALLIHTNDLEGNAVAGHTEVALRSLIDIIKGLGGPQIGYGDSSIPDAFVLLRR